MNDEMNTDEWVFQVHMEMGDLWQTLELGTEDYCRERHQWYVENRPDLEEEGKLRVVPVESTP